jgi:hypothetical protein
MSRGEVTMPEHLLGNAAAAEEEIARVLQRLRKLQDEVSLPIIQACLEEAQADIVHLTGCDVPPPSTEPSAA